MIYNLRAPNPGWPWQKAISLEKPTLKEVMHNRGSAQGSVKLCNDLEDAMSAVWPSFTRLNAKVKPNLAAL